MATEMQLKAPFVTAVDANSDIEAHELLTPATRAMSKKSSLKIRRPRGKAAKVWKHSLRWILSLMVTCGVAIGIVLAPNISEYGNCYTNGKLSLINEPPSLWSISQLLTITLPFGKFTYTEVKLIDAAWTLFLADAARS